MADSSVKKFGLIPAEKIFGIGLGKTGTKSLSRAGYILGYNAGHGAKFFPHLRDIQFWCGGTAPAGRFKFLDHYFPHAKFILTIRSDLDAWIKSCQHWCLRKGGSKILQEIEHYRDGMIDTKITKSFNRWLAFGRVNYNKEDFLVAYQRHNAEVLEHFKGREEKLLLMDICAGDDWEVLCPFLGCEIPDMPFPHKHKQFDV